MIVLIVPWSSPLTVWTFSFLSILLRSLWLGVIILVSLLRRHLDVLRVLIMLLWCDSLWGMILITTGCDLFRCTTTVSVV